MWRFFENSRTVNCQTRFLCSRVAISESHGSCSASFYVHFLFVLLDGAKTHNLALERLISYRFVRILLILAHCYVVAKVYKVLYM